MQMACLETQTRSISDFARAAVRHVLAVGFKPMLGPGADVIPSNLNGHLEKVEEILGLLVHEVREVGKRLGSPVHSE